jgi:ABC-type sugar transport system permease subunit
VSPWRRGSTRAAWTFLLPALAVYACFALLPIAQGLGMSFFGPEKLAGASQEGAAWRGLANYAEALGDPVFWRAVGNNVLLAALSLLVQIPIALLLAALLAGRLRGRWIFRTAYFAPMVLPTVVIAVFWCQFLNVNYGLPGEVLSRAGASRPDWLGNPSLVFGSVFAAISWRYVGFHTVILLAGMLAVPGELYEAAALDGASGWGRFRHVTLPQIREALLAAVLLSVVGSIKYFDLVFIMTEGGPDHASELGATYIYNVGIAQGRWGYGCALATLLLGVSLLVAALVLGTRRWREARA